MKKLLPSKPLVLLLNLSIFLFLTFFVLPQAASAQSCPNDYPVCTQVQTEDLGFKIPSLGDILTFAIRAFFVVAGLLAFFYMLLGALAWVTAGGEKDGVKGAREKIQTAVVGMIVIVVVLAIIWTLENVIFKRRVCVGLTCPVTIPGLIETTTGTYYCCCPNPDGTISGNAIDVYSGQRCPAN